jgi:protein phosphatase
MGSGHNPVAGPVVPGQPWPGRADGSISAASRRGPAHGENEDRWGLAGADDLLLLAVADGMGGTVGGGTAAGIGLRTLLELADRRPDPGSDPEPTTPELAIAGPTTAQPAGHLPAASAGTALLAAMTRAHHRVQAAAAPGLPAALRPGSTLTAALVVGDWLVVGHVGDSACWLLRRGALIRLTEEHTYAAALVAAGAVERGSPAARRLGNLLTRHLGMPGKLRPDLTAVRLQAGDRLLLATDGLARALPPAALAALLARPETTAGRLVGAAVAVGATDDVTAVLASVGPAGSGYAAAVGVAAGEPAADLGSPGDGGGAAPGRHDERQLAAGAPGSGPWPAVAAGR